MRRFSLVTFMLLACRGNSDRYPDFSGMWDTPFGYMQIVQERDRVKGKYRSELGSLDGRIKGDTLYFVWNDPDGSGDGFFVLSADGKAIDGAYRRQGEADWEGGWWGVKLSR
ncbi:MAG: hypothetical protein ACP5QG_08040 [candidate division WOR-3 bacterium]